MKRFLQILASRVNVGDDTVDRLCRVVPSGSQGTSFQARLKDDSPECAEVLRVLEAAGCRPRKLGQDYGPGLFSMQPSYEYEPTDLDRASYFQMLPHASADTKYGRTPEGILNLQQQGLAKKGPLLITGVRAVLVSTPLRAEMEAEGFVGLAFRPTRVVQGNSYDALKEVPWPTVGCEPYWELWSSAKLPPLSPRCLLLNEKGEPITGDDRSKSAFLVEDQFPAGELHYRRSDIETVEPFDVALTLERLATARDQVLVVSRRVHDFINSRRLKVRWLPVYVDDE